jgi:hypothetical protein
MVIIWRGYGWLVVVIVFGCSLIANLVFNATYGEGYYVHHKWPVAVAMLGAAASCWFLGDALRKRTDRIAIDKASGREFVVNQSSHTLFFIPMHLWGPVLAALGAVLVVMELIE